MRNRRAWFLVGAALIVLGLAAGLSSSGPIRRRGRSLGSRIRDRRLVLSRRRPAGLSEGAGADRLDVEPDIAMSAEDFVE